MLTMKRRMGGGVRSNKTGMLHVKGGCAWERDKEVIGKISGNGRIPWSRKQERKRLDCLDSDWRPTLLLIFDCG